MRNDLKNTLSGLIPDDKIASSDLAHLSLFELEALMGGEKVAGEVEYTGQVNNGDPKMPEWPRAALGVDSAGRKATPEERRRIEGDVATPQHVEPHSDGKDFVAKTSAERKLLEAVKRAGDLSASAREDLPKKDFALPKQEKFPIPDEAHARNALARASQFGSPAVQAKVRAKVHQKFPGIHETAASKPEQPTVKKTITKVADLSGLLQGARKGLMPVSRLGARSTASGLGAAEGAIASRAARAIPPPVPSQAQGLFRAPAVSPFAGTAPGAAKAVAPVAPMGRGSMQHPSFLARQPGGAEGLASNYLTANAGATRARMAALPQTMSPAERVQHLLSQEAAQVKAASLRRKIAANKHSFRLN